MSTAMNVNNVLRMQNVYSFIQCDFYSTLSATHTGLEM